MQKYYKAEMDRLLTITTSIVSVILLAPAALTAFFWYKNKFGQAGVSPGRPGAELLLLAALLPATAYITGTSGISVHVRRENSASILFK